MALRRAVRAGRLTGRRPSREVTLRAPSPERWQEVERVLDAALDRPTGERAAFLDAACGHDAELRAEVERLLRAHEQAVGFLEEAPPDLAPALLEGGALFESGAPGPASPLALPRTVGRYAVERELGRGGMATVYLARDLKHDRNVALKVLGQDVAAGLGTERFLREIRIAARLQHPHILALIDSGEIDGSLYYVMPYVAGESLRERLRRERPLPLDETLRIAREVADALDYAHGEGVVHRDVKPANILLSHGHALVADFGIAKALSTAVDQGSDGAQLTRTGVAIGTPAYMSPEQASGEHDVDARSDIYSLGCILYEMLAGEPPYTGPTAAAVIVKHFTEPVPPLRARRAGLPTGVEDAVARALAKAPADRFATAADFIRAVMRPVAGSTATAVPGAAVGAARPERTSVAVLPFANLSPDPGGEYFADGLADEVIADLSKLRSLRVISRGSTMRLKGTTTPPADLARELGVRYLVEGSVRRAKDRLRVTAQLVDAADGSTVWADTLGGAADDIFAIQERLAASIVGALRLTLTPEERRKLAERPLPDVRAYEFYLQARHELWTFTPTSLDRARQLLENALAIVGENALLYAALGQVHTHYLEAGIAREGALAEAERCMRRVFELEPDSPHGHRLLGWIYYKRGRTRQAAHALERARAPDPNNADVLALLAYVYLLGGLDEAGRQIVDELVAIDPLTPLIQCMPGIVEILRGRFDAALPYYRRFRAMDPTNPAAYWFLESVLGLAGEVDEASATADDLVRRFPRTVFASIGQAFACGLRGEADAARRAITPELRAAAEHAEFLARQLADCYALAGDTDAALDWLAQAVRQGFAHYRYLEWHNPFLGRVRDDPRFRELLETVRARGLDVTAA